MRERIKNIFSFFFEHLEYKRLPFYSGSLTAGVGKGKGKLEAESDPE